MQRTIYSSFPYRAIALNMQTMNLAHLTTTSTALRIVDARSCHIAAIHDIYAHYVQHALCTMEEVAPTEKEMHRRHDALRREGLPWLVALEGADVVGYAYAARYRSRAGYAATLETSIYIDKNRQGMGVGRALLDALIQAGRQFGARQMVAVIVGDEGTTGSIRLHEHFGFQQVGVFTGVGRKFGRDVDTLLLQRDLLTT